MSDKCDTPLPHQRPQICAPKVVTEDRCVVIDCEYKTVKVTTTTLADCSQTVVIMDGTTVLPPDTKLMSCKEPTPVINVCSEESADVTGADCAGAPITAKGVQTIPHPTAVQLVKLCEPQKDYEVERACNAAGEPVLVQYDAGVVPPTELSRTNMLTGAPEPAGTLRKCDSDEVELVNLVACLNGVEIVGVAVMTDKDLPVMTGELWRDPTTGAWGALPAGAVIGKCVQQNLHLNSVHWTVAGTCIEGKAWYDESTGALVRVNTLDGVDVTATVAAASLKEGSCPEICEIETPVGVVSTWG